MQELDIAISSYINGFAGRSSLADGIILELAQLNTFKMMPVVALMVWLWFSDQEEGIKRRAVLNGVIGGFAALVTTRIIQNLSPYRPRPAFAGTFEFVVPEGGNMSNDWSSFPSDTSGLAFALALAIWQASRPLGAISLIWAATIISFPRLYGGWHYISDLVAGAAIGMLCTWTVSHIPLVSKAAFNLGNKIPARHKALLYLLAFVIAFQMSTYFADIRKVGSGALKALGIEKSVTGSMRNAAEL